MINFKNTLAIAALCGLAPAAFAGSQYFRAPYVGVEVIQTNQDYKSGFGKDVFKKNPQYYNIFAGFKFSCHFGAEAGYDFQPRRNKVTTLGPGQSTPGGAVIASGDSVGTNANIKGEHPYLGLFGEIDQSYSWVRKMKYQALIAASFSHISANETITSVNGSPTNTFTSYSKSRVVPMVKLSATGSMTDHLGLRVSLNYLNLSEFKIRADQGGTAQIKLKDSWGIGVGLTYSFF